MTAEPLNEADELRAAKWRMPGSLAAYCCGRLRLPRYGYAGELIFH